MFYPGSSHFCSPQLNAWFERALKPISYQDYGIKINRLIFRRSDSAVSVFVPWSNFSGKNTPLQPEKPTGSFKDVKKCIKYTHSP